MKDTTKNVGLKVEKKVATLKNNRTIMNHQVNDTKK